MKPVCSARAALTVSLVLLIVAATANASNLGYWLKLGVVSNGPTAGLYWLPIPYLYTPANAEELVQDLQPSGLPACTGNPAGCAVAEVLSWDEATGEYVSWTGGGTGTPFDLVPGKAYLVRIQLAGGQTAHILPLAGANDNSVTFDDCHAPGAVNLRWISIPPSLAINTDFGIDGVLDAEDLGQAMGGPTKVFQIRRLNEATGLYDNWPVGSAYGTPFEIDLTQAYGIDLTCADLAAPCNDCPWTWTPTTY